MRLLQFFFAFGFIIFNEIVKFCMKRPLVALLFIFGFWLNSFLLPDNSIVKSNEITVLNQKSHLNPEYQALIGSDQDKVRLVAFRGKFLVNFNINLDKKTDRLNTNFRVLQKNSEDPSKDLDLTACIPEDRLLAKLYHIESFGVIVPKEIDLERARNLPTKPRLEYLRDKTSIKTVEEAYSRFSNHLNDDKTEIFLGQFGEGFKNNDTYDGF